MLCTDSIIDTDLLSHFKTMLTHPSLEKTKLGIVLAKVDLPNANTNFKDFAMKLGFFNAKQNKLFMQGFMRKYTMTDYKTKHKQLYVLQNDLLSLFLEYIDFGTCGLNKHKIKFFAISNRTFQGYQELEQWIRKNTKSV